MARQKMAIVASGGWCAEIRRLLHVASKSYEWKKKLHESHEWSCSPGVELRAAHPQKVRFRVPRRARLAAPGALEVSALHTSGAAAFVPRSDLLSRLCTDAVPGDWPAQVLHRAGRPGDGHDRRRDSLQVRRGRGERSRS